MDNVSSSIPHHNLGQSKPEKSQHLNVSLYFILVGIFTLRLIYKMPRQVFLPVWEPNTVTAIEGRFIGRTF